MDPAKKDIRRIEAFEMWIWHRMLTISWTEHKRNDKVLKQLKREENSGKHWGIDRKSGWDICVASWFFGENYVGRSTAREKRKRKTKRNATELVTRDKRRGHGLLTTKEASTIKSGQDGVDEENVNLLIGAEYNSSSRHARNYQNELMSHGIIHKNQSCTHFLKHGVDACRNVVVRRPRPTTCCVRKKIYSFLWITLASLTYFYARKQLLLSARLSYRNSVRLSVRPSVTRVDQSKTVQARITKSSPRLPGGLLFQEL